MLRSRTPARRPLAKTLTAGFLIAEFALQVAQARPLLLRLDAQLEAERVADAHELAHADVGDGAPVDALVVDVLKDLAGDDAVLTYSANAHEVIDAVREGKAQAGVLVNATTVEDVLAVADAGAVMPPKSTYFMPKVPSGLVLMPLGGEGG